MTHNKKFGNKPTTTYLTIQGCVHPNPNNIFTAETMFKNTYLIVIKSGYLQPEDCNLLNKQYPLLQHHWDILPFLLKTDVTHLP